MKSRLALWMQLGVVVAAALYQVGCFSMSKDEETGPKSTDPAFGNLCNGLSFDGGIGEIRATFKNEDDDTAMLSARTGACDAPLDSECGEIPTGDKVQVKVTASWTSQPLMAGELKIEPNIEYEFYADIDTDSLPVLYTRDLTADELHCNMSECNTLMYTRSTCDEKDPCGWAGDGICDELCVHLTPSPFDDSADCSQ